MKKRRNSKRNKLYDQIHAEMRRIAIKRHPVCVCCGGTNILQGGHLISRRKMSTRFDLMNVFTQCKSCNGKHRYYPEIFTNWFLRQYGQEEFDYLVERSQKTKKYSIPELEELLEKYKQINN